MQVGERLGEGIAHAAGERERTRPIENLPRKPSFCPEFEGRPSEEVDKLS